MSVELDRRALVPSEREEVQDPIRARPAEPEPRRARIRLSDLDPRAIVREGPTLPFVAMALSGLVTQWDDHAFGVLLPEIRADFQADVAFIVGLQVFFGLVRQMIAPAFGYLADRVKRVWLLRAGSIVANGSSIATGLAGGIPMLAGARLGVQAGDAIVAPAGFPLLVDLYPSKVRARLFAFLGVAGNIGAAVGPVVAGTIAVVWGWRVAMVGLGALALGVSLLFFFVREPARGYVDRLEQGLGETAARTEPPPVGWREGWRAAARVHTIRRLWFAAPFLGAISVGTLSLMSFYYADEFGVGPQGRGLITSLSFGIGVGALVLGGPVADRAIRTRPGSIMVVMGAALVLQAVVFVMLWVSPTVVVSAALNIALAAVSATFLPALYAMLSLTIPPRIRGLGLSSALPFYAIGGLAIPVVTSIADTGGWRPAMLVFVPVALVAAAILGTAGPGVARDIASARAAAVAGEAAARARTTLLVARGIEVHHAGVQALFGVDLDVVDGEALALLGVNGAGKSTLLRAIAGVEPASSGAVVFDGRDVTHVPPSSLARDGIVLLPGGRAVLPTLTVRENLRAAAWLHGAHIEDALEWFPELGARLGVPAGALSGGEQHMLGLAMAFLSRPRLLLLDELSLGLAPPVIERLHAIVREIRARGTTLIVVEQDPAAARALAERAVFMEKGEVVFDGPLDELLGRSDLLRPAFLARAGIGPLAAARAEPSGRVALEARALVVDYGGVRALDGVSLEVRAGEITAIVGSNGAGKTTLFDALAGTVPATGTVALHGEVVGMLEPDARARRGLVRSFQAARLFPTLTVRETIAVALERHLGRMRASPREERGITRRVGELVDTFGLGHEAERRVGELSTATRRIVDLACAAAAQPSVVLLDEPSAGLAAAETTMLPPMLRRLVRETGCAMLLIEHDRQVVEQTADLVVTMELGRIVG